MVTQASIMTWVGANVVLPALQEQTSKLIAHIAGGRTQQFLAARDEMYRDWLHEAVQQLHEVEQVVSALAETVGKVDEIQKQLAERADDHEARAVLANYALQAYQEPLDERRRMLAFAAAGIVDVRLSIAELARVQRRLDELEPIDVLTLYGISRTYGRVWNGQLYSNEKEMRAALLFAQPDGGDALMASGCVRFEHEPGGPFVSAHDALPDHPQLVLTSFGWLLLRVLRAYCLARKPPFVVPGREHVDGERTREEAYAAFPLAERARDALAPLVLARKPDGFRYQGTFWTGGERDGSNHQPPKARGCARLDADHLSAEEAKQLHAIAPVYQMQEPIHGSETDRFGVWIQKSDESGERWMARIFGPHDVLRHVADDLDVRWF